jgi:serine/threonine protein phosphatase PrpC
MPNVSQLILAQYEKTGGARASTALLYKGKLYAAGLGDSRIIAVWKKTESSMRVMVQDHNGFNPAEVER